MRKTKIIFSFFLKKFPILIFAAAICLLFSLSASAAGKIVLRLSAETVIENERVTLGDIAEISGAGEETINRLKAVSLGYAPNVGLTREMRKQDILLAVAAAGFANMDFALDAPTRVIVRRAAQIVSRDSLREAVEKAVLTNFQNGDAAVKIVRLDLPTNVRIPTGNTQIRASASDVANFFAPFSVSLEIRVNEQIAHRFSVTANIEATAEVLVAARDLKPGDKISEADVTKETRRLEKSLKSYLRDGKNLRGMVLLKHITAGAEITTDAIAAGYVVRAGDSVRIVGGSGKTQIIINGEARTSGRIGDRISVKNLQSGAILQAQVTDEGAVKILF